jgi:putative ABC transport system permease protein
MGWLRLLVPRSWRDTVLRDIEDEAHAEGRGRIWVAAQVLRVALRLGMTVRGEAWWFDLRHAARALWRSKPFAVGAMLTFGLGIGVNLAVFSIVDRMMLRPLPYAEAHELVVMEQYNPRTQQRYGTLDPALVVAVRDRVTAASGLAVIDQARGFGLAPDGSTSLVINDASITLLEVLGVAPVIGRLPREDDLRVQRHVVLVTHEVWHTHFGGRPDVLGSRLWSQGESAEIIGVLPAEFFPPPSVFAGRSDGIGLKLRALQLPYPERSRETPPIIRLKDGVHVDALQTEINTIVGAETHVRLVPIRTFIFGPYATYTWVVIVAASLVLMMCCANLASLMFLRARARHNDVALKVALGASRARLVRGAVIESLLLSASGAIVALTVVTWSHAAIRAFVPAIFRLYAVEPTEMRVLAWGAIATVISALIAGVGPVLRTTGARHTASLQPGASMRITRSRMGGSLIAAEALIGVILVSGAAMTARSLVGLTRTDLGFQHEGLQFVSVQYPTYLPDTAVRFRDYTQALDALRSTPGLSAVAAGDVLPMMGAAGMQSFAESGYVWRVTDQFFGTMGMPLRAGRDFTSDEVRTEAAVGIISELGLKQVWPGLEPGDVIGRSVQLDELPSFVVIGVVGDVRSSHASDPRASLYLPIRQEGFRILRFVARLTGDADGVVADAQRRLADTGRQATVVMDPVDRALANSLRDQRFQTTLFGAFAVVGLVLSAVGLFAVTAFEVRLRRTEMGVRLALGASPSQLRRRVLLVALRPALVGILTGLTVAWWAGSFLQAFLHKVDARDTGTLLGVGLVLVVTVLLAAWPPARRASRVDPAIVLRTE